MSLSSDFVRRQTKWPSPMVRSESLIISTNSMATREELLMNLDLAAHRVAQSASRLSRQRQIVRTLKDEHRDSEDAECLLAILEQLHALSVGDRDHLLRTLHLPATVASATSQIQSVRGH